MIQSVMLASRARVVLPLVFLGLILAETSAVYPASASQTVRGESGLSRADTPIFDTVTSHTAEILQLLAGDLDGDNNADIVYAPIMSAGLYVAYGREDVSLDLPENILSSAVHATLRFGLVDADTLVDLIAASKTTMYILLNNGDRSFAVSSFGMVGEEVPTMETGYFNADPYLDIVVSPRQIFFGDGTGGFPTSVTLPFAFDVAGVNDFNNDGIDDLLLYAGKIYIYLNDGNASFTVSDSVPSLGLELTTTVTNDVVDFDRDGNADFAVISPELDTSMVTIGFGDGTGHVSQSTQLFITGRASSLIVTDVDRDNRLDLVAGVGSVPGRMDIYLGDGARGFAPPTSLVWEDNIIAYALGCADFDRDGNPDFVTGPMVSAGPIQFAVNALPDRPVISAEMVTTLQTYSVEVVNPATFVVSKNYRTVAGSALQRLDLNADGYLDERALDYNVEYGEYAIIIRKNPGAPGGSTLTCSIRIDGSQQHEIFSNYDVFSELKSAMQEGDSIVFYFDVEEVSSVSPENGGAVVMTSPTFRWFGLVPPEIVADSFNFQLDRYHDFRSSPSLRYDISDLIQPQVTLSGSLGLDSIYYWRVRWFADGSWSDFSHAFAAKAVESCCGLFTGGFTGNTDCDTGGKMNLQDVTRLIDRIYLSRLVLCCEENGDTNADGTMNLQDVTRLIDHIYLSKNPTAACQ